MASAYSGGSAALHEGIAALMRDASERAILPRFGQLASAQVSDKAVDEPVTIADRESEAILAEGLARLIPEAMIVGEEAADADPAVRRGLGERLCWIIDPLDGTGNFVTGEGPFGILVALAEHGVAIGGWIYDPRSTRFIAGMRGEGTTLNGAPLRARGSDGGPRTVALSSLLTGERRQSLVGALEPQFEPVAIPRCAAEQYPRLMLGVNDLTLFGRTLPWDHAAGVLCLTEAGGVATRFDGSPYRVDDDRDGLIAAATPQLWEEALGLLRPDQANDAVQQS